jgi:hypothetical protein
MRWLDQLHWGWIAIAAVGLVAALWWCDARGDR